MMIFAQSYGNYSSLQFYKIECNKCPLDQGKQQVRVVYDGTVLKAGHHVALCPHQLQYTRGVKIKLFSL